MGHSSEYDYSYRGVSVEVIVKRKKNWLVTSRGEKEWIDKRKIVKIKRA